MIARSEETAPTKLVVFNNYLSNTSYLGTYLEKKNSTKSEMRGLSSLSSRFWSWTLQQRKPPPPQSFEWVQEKALIFSVFGVTGACNAQATPLLSHELNPHWRFSCRHHRLVLRATSALEGWD